jgi:hypothetical protein
MLYEERRIDKGWEFYEESKQEVSFLRKADPPRPAEVVSADDVSPAVWSIQIVPSPENSAQQRHSLARRSRRRVELISRTCLYGLSTSQRGSALGKN